MMKTLKIVLTSILPLAVLIGGDEGKYRDELVNLYGILEKDDDVIFKWYSNKDISDSNPDNKVSKLLKKFKFKE